MRVSLALRCRKIPCSCTPEGDRDYGMGSGIGISSQRYFSYFGNTASLPSRQLPCEP